MLTSPTNSENTTFCVSLFTCRLGGPEKTLYLIFSKTRLRGAIIIKKIEKGDVRVSFPPFSWGNGWNYFVVFNASHSSMGCLANQRRLCPSWKWREPEPEPIEEWLELFCWLLGIAVNNLIPAIPSWKWRETDSNIPLLKLFGQLIAELQRKRTCNSATPH